jgi:hypothetical protein
MLSTAMRREDLESVLGEMEQRLHSRHIDFWCWPSTGIVSTRTTQVTDAASTQSAVRRFLQDFVVENAGLWIVNSTQSPPQAALTPTGERVDRPYRLLATPRLVKLLETEYSVPAEAGPDCLREIKEWIDKSHVPISFPIEYRYVAAEDSFLSPYYGRASAMIDLQQFKGMPYREYFLAGEEIFKRYDGRPHWGKLHSRTADELRPCTPSGTAPGGSPALGP